MIHKWNRKPKILVVDDCAQNVDLLEAYLTAADYDVATAADGEDALEKIGKENFDLIISDIMMPKLNGYDLCRRLKSDEETRLIPVILITALRELNDKIKGIEAGADDFLNKPFNSLELLARAKSLIKTKQLNENLENAKNVILTLSLAVEAHDPFLRGHSERVADYSRKLAEELGFDQKFNNSLKEAAILHDLGKLGISRAILHKPGPLTMGEFTEVKKHPEIGEKICEPLKTTHIKLPVIRHHHERIDGRGYPDKLAGTAIPMGARIMAVADAFDAMVSDRPYRRALSVDQAIAILKQGSGKQWDDELVKVFIDILKKSVSWEDSAKKRLLIKKARA